MDGWMSRCVDWYIRDEIQIWVDEWAYLWVINKWMIR